MTFKKLNNLFRHDSNYVQILDYLQQGTPPTNKKLNDQLLGEFELHNGLIYHKPTGATVVPSDSVDDVLEEEWGDIRKSAGKGVGSFYDKVRENYIGITRDRVRAFLEKQPDYQLTQPFSKKTNRPIIAKKANERWAIDLVDMSRFKGANRGFMYILTVVDVFSRYMWLVGLKRKESADVRDAMRGIIQGVGFKPMLLHCDQGQEFAGLLEEYCKSENIKQIKSRSYSPESNGLVESLNRRVREAINHIMVRNKNRKWVDYLDVVCEAWNTSKHANQNHSPDYLYLSTDADFNEEREQARQVLEAKAEKAILRNTTEEYEKGDVVRIALAATDSRVRKEMKTGRVRNIKWHPIKWSPDLYRIVTVMKAETVDAERLTKWRYTVEPVVEGGKTYRAKQFFANELQLVVHADKEIPEGAEQPRSLLKKLNRLKPKDDEPDEERRSRPRERRRQREDDQPMPSPSPSRSPSPKPRPVRERRQPERLGWLPEDYLPKEKKQRSRRPAPAPLPPLRRSTRERQKKIIYDISHF